MDPESATALAKGLIIFTMVSTSLAEAILISAAFRAIGRNPKIEESLFPKVIISIALVESTAIYALVAFFTL